VIQNRFSFRVQAKIFAECFKACLCCGVACEAEAVKSEVAEYQRGESAGSVFHFCFQSNLEIPYLMEKYELNLL